MMKKTNKKEDAKQLFVATSSLRAFVCVCVCSVSMLCSSTKDTNREPFFHAICNFILDTPIVPVHIS